MKRAEQQTAQTAQTTMTPRRRRAHADAAAGRWGLLREWAQESRILFTTAGFLFPLSVYATLGTGLLWWGKPPRGAMYRPGGISPATPSPCGLITSGGNGFRIPPPDKPALELGAFERT
ncbi:hypothetical protein AAFF_G00013090 [Aldrovandia affinis]|uniref:Uncharacterized protein n=1 Tax=Aldrovandia affinis TaxID=143900 RepID=A0AAD7WH82_9TELE|nr:hypothetical protein AAFF_G00013090 [Aldrovandia affinis]